MSAPSATSLRLETTLAERDAALAAITARWNRIGNWRVIAAATLVLSALWWAYGDAPPGGALAIAAVIASVALAIRHARIGRAKAAATVLATAAREAVWRHERDWERLPVRHATAPPADHPYAADLDLFGHGSLMHLLDTTVTPAGRATLAAWLLAPATPSAVRARQAAVRELAGRSDLRDGLLLAPTLGGALDADPAPFLAWAEQPPLLAGVPLVRWAARLSPMATLALVIAQIDGALDQPFWIVPIIANILLAQRVGGQARARIAAACSQSAAIGGYAAVLDLLDRADPTAPRLRELLEASRVAGHAAGDRLRWLGRIARWRMPAGSIGSLPAQWFLCWDINHLAWLERWQQQAGAAVRRWIAIAGEVEALTALATLAANQPDWAYPDIADDADAIAATDLGHPLLRDDRRIGNDVTVGPSGAFLLVTGSNMSGKSTLLRSIGLAVVLANAGAPVCASALTLPPLALWTSVRVQDSLTRGVSFFMAELMRLKLIVDAANAPAVDGRRVCFILDEMLQGTNTAERQIAARRIIRHLVARGALGAVSTHDLTLADGPELATLAVPVHLGETVGTDASGPAMRFDYRLRPGVATSTNALRLMRLVGFALDDTPPPAS